MTSAPPGWYPDPADPRYRRWWDGYTWGPLEGYQAPPGPWPTAPMGPYGYGYGVPTTQVGSGYSTAAIVIGCFAFLIFPIVLGPIALFLASKAKSKGEPRAKVAMVVAGLGFGVGMVLGALFVLAR